MEAWCSPTRSLVHRMWSSMGDCAAAEVSGRVDTFHDESYIGGDIMAGWGIHLEDGKYVIRMMARSTEEVDAGLNQEGKKVGKGYSTRISAALKIRELEIAERKKARK